MNRTWLIRTKKNKILGPLSKEKVFELYESRDLTENDEICSGNGYWFWIKEKELVKKYLLGDTEQSFNPVCEAQTVLVNGSSGSVLAKQPEKKKDNTQVLKTPQELLKKDTDDILIPSEEDLDYPDENFVNELKDRKEIFESSASVSTAAKNKDRKVTKNTSLKIDKEEIVLPTEDDLSYPDEVNTEKKKLKSDSTDYHARKKKRKAAVKISNVKTPEKKRSDLYLLYILGALVSLIVYIIYSYYTDILGYKVLQSRVSLFLQDSHAQVFSDVKKKNEFGPFQYDLTLNGLKLSYDVDSITCDKKYDLYALALLKKNKQENKLFQLIQLPKCQDLMNIEIKESLLSNSKTFLNFKTSEIERLRNSIQSEVKNEYSEKDVFSSTTYLGLLFRTQYLISKKENLLVERLLEKLIKTPIRYLIYELTIISQSEREDYKNRVLNILKLIALNENINIKQRYLFLISLDELNDREIKRLINDFQYKNDEEIYSIDRNEYNYYLKYLSFWIERQSELITTKPLVSRYFASPLRHKISINDINLFKYNFSNNYKVDKSLSEIYNKDIEEFTTYQLEKIFYSFQNNYFKKKIEEINLKFRRPLFQLERKVYKGKVYKDVHGIFAMMRLIQLGEYNQDFFWWFYEI